MRFVGPNDIADRTYRVGYMRQVQEQFAFTTLRHRSNSLNGNAPFAAVKHYTAVVAAEIDNDNLFRQCIVAGMHTAFNIGKMRLS